MSYSPEELKAKLTGGLIPATPVMFDREHRFHDRAHEAYVSFMSSQPVAGVAVWAHTGRGLLLDDEIARRVLQQWRQEIADKPLIVGAGALSMASAAAAGGADALLAYPPTWLKQHERRDSLIVEHHERLSSVGLPIILFYLYEAAGGVSYSATVLDELLSLPNVVGIKMATLDSVMNSENSRAAATPLETSAAIARAKTIPPPPAIPWKNRQITSRPADGASAHNTEASAQTRVDPSSSRRRPQASDIGPRISCPTTMPMTSAVSVSWTAD